MGDGKKAIAALAVATDDGGREVVLTLKDEAGTAFKVRLDAGIVGGIVGSLLALGSRLKVAGENELRAQPITITACRPATLDGRPVLDLQLEGTMSFPVTFPRSAIPALQQALSILQQTSTADPPKPPLTRN